MQKWPFRLIDGLLYLAAAIALVGVTAWGVAAQSTPVWLVAAIAGGVVYARASGQYRTWALARHDRWYWRQSLLAGVGIVLDALAAMLLQHSSTVNSPPLAAVGMALLVTGFMPVMHVVRTDINPTPQPTIKYVQAWLLNLLVIVLAVVPGMLIVGAQWWAAAGIAGAWFASALVDRVGHHGWYKVIVGLSAVGLVVCVWLVMGPDASHRSSSALAVLVGGAIVVLLGLVDAISARFRNLRFPDITPAARRRRLTTALGVCAAVTVVATIWLVPRLGGVRWQIQVLIVVGCIAFGASFLTRGQGFAVVALLGGLVVWTVTDRTDPAPLDPGSAGQGTIVALGDSYIAGEGAELFFDETNVEGHNNCRRSSTAFPYLVAEALHEHLLFVACSGALAHQIWEDGQIRHGTDGGPIGALPQLDNEFPETPDVVLISIGGNDALFGEIGKGCAFPGSCTDLATTFDGNLERVQANVTTALRKVGERFPDSPVVVVPYPQMLSATACTEAPLDKDELPYLRTFVQRLDQRVAAAVVAANAELASPNLIWFEDGVQAYQHRELCSGSVEPKPINVITLAPSENDDLAQRMVPTRWTHNSFHPTRDGHQLMATALTAFLQAHVPAFGGTLPAAATGASSPTEPSSAADPPTCAERAACQQVVSGWMAGQAVTSLRLVFLPLVALLAAGWLASFAIRRHRV